MLCTAPSLDVMIGIPPQLSVAVAVPSAALISPADGLHPREVPVPPVVRVGPVLSSNQLVERDAVDVLPQASLAVQVLTFDL